MNNDDGIILQMQEGGAWGIKKEPYCTIEVATKEDYEKLQEILEKHQKNGWTPVSERLPEEDFTDALTCDKYGNIHVLSHYDSQRYPFGIKPNNPNLFMPIAWQPLPEPYKEENHD